MSLFTSSPININYEFENILPALSLFVSASENVFDTCYLWIPECRIALLLTHDLCV